MKISTDTTKYKTNITSAADFGIEEQDLSHIMGILRSQIYSDKLLAVIREYSTNAVDANIEAGFIGTGPIDIKLPTMADSTLSFRDYGNGLTDDEVCSLYVKYGASTKRSSNDYTGCLGIGCKAGFAYGDSFTVISYTTNKINTWLARIDESKKGTISLLNSKHNHDPGNTGTEIQVAIRKQDIDDCVKKAKQFFKYWLQQPNINTDLESVNVFEQTNDWIIANTDNQHGYYNRGNAKLIMGNIMYPLDSSKANISNTAANLLQCPNVILLAPMGAVDIAANRESLEYTDRTRNALTAMTNNMLIDLTTKLSTQIKDQPSRIKASISSHHYDDVLPNTVSNIIKQNTKWRNLPLINNISLNGKTVTKHYRKKRSWRSDEYVFTKDTKISSFSLQSNMTLCVHDTNNIPLANATRRIRQLQENNNNNIQDVFVVINKSDLPNCEPFLTTKDYTNLDDVTPLPANRTIIAKDGTKSKVKAVRINVCEVKPASLKSERFTKDEITNPIPCQNTGKIVYIPKDRYNWLGFATGLDHLDEINKAIILFNAGYPRPNIYGVNKQHVKKLNDTWISLDKYLELLVSNYKKDVPNMYKLGLQLTSSNNNEPGWDWRMIHCIEQANIKEIQEYLKIYNYDKTNDMNQLINAFNTAIQFKAIEQSDYLSKKGQIIKDKYPMLFYTSHLSYQHDKDEYLKVIKQYAKLINQS